MVDEVRVLRLLRSISDDLTVLRAEASADPGRRTDPLWLRGVKYTFVTAIEGSVDVAQHVCASQGWGPPRDNGDAIRLLGAHGVLSADLADRLRRVVGFRNVLVHDYVEVDDGIVLERLANLADLEDFVAVVATWVVPPRS
ncbi:MAG: type VII toxin-antitoxin system HepT family RNase toxin [Pseudonocardiaceae bacterium]